MTQRPPRKPGAGFEIASKAAIEALAGSECDLLLVLAFAFEASVLEQTADLTKEKRFGRLRVLPARVNPDLAMFGGDAGEELLKKSKGNLFTVFGEPDVTLPKPITGRVAVKVINHFGDEVLKVVSLWPPAK